METGDPQHVKSDGPLRFPVWSIGGAAVGFVIGIAIVRELRGGIVGALGGALIGGALGGRLISTTGWLMILGAIVGGLLAIVVTGFGKAVIYGAPIGAGLGLCLGLAMKHYAHKKPARTLRILIGLMILAIVVLAGYLMTRRSYWPTNLSNDLPANVVSILKGATKVESFRVSPEPTTDESGDTINGYPVMATGKDQALSFAKRLSAVLLRGGVTQNRKKCGLRPGVAFRIWKDQEAVDVLICFECDVLWPHVVGETSEHPTWEWQDFDPVREELVNLSKEAFPDDQVIQSLSRSR